MQIARDLDSMAKASNITNRSISVKPTQQAIACCEYIVSLQQVAQEEPDEQFRQEAALRYFTSCTSACGCQLRGSIAQCADTGFLCTARLWHAISTGLVRMSESMSLA